GMPLSSVRIVCVIPLTLSVSVTCILVVLVETRMINIVSLIFTGSIALFSTKYWYHPVAPAFDDQTNVTDLPADNVTFLCSSFFSTSQTISFFNTRLST